MCGSILVEVEGAAKRRCVAVFFQEVERAAKGKCVTVFLGRLREQEKEIIWQYSWVGLESNKKKVCGSILR